MTPTTQPAEHTNEPYPPVLDACCGSRMFWFDRKDSRALYIDKRRETHLAKDCSVKNGEREIVVAPDMIADFTSMPFPDSTFSLVVFDGHRTGKAAKTHWVAFMKQAISNLTPATDKQG